MGPAPARSIGPNFPAAKSGAAEHIQLVAYTISPARPDQSPCGDGSAPPLSPVRRRGRSRRACSRRAVVGACTGRSARSRRADERDDPWREDSAATAAVPERTMGAPMAAWINPRPCRDPTQGDISRRMPSRGNSGCRGISSLSIIDGQKRRQEFEDGLERALRKALGDEP